MVEAVLADHRTAPISDELKAMLTYLEKVTTQTVTVEDAKALRASGVTKEQAHDALFVAFCFNQIVRIADALDWEMQSPEGFAAGARSLLKFGYTLPLAGKAKK